MGIEVWEPQVIAAGWRYWAIVQPEHVIAKWRMAKLAEMYSKKRDYGSTFFRSGRSDAVVGKPVEKFLCVVLISHN
jgi:hypothetical protein